MTDTLDGQGIIVVDDDDEFLNETKLLFEGRVPTISTLADALRTVEDSEVDLVILGPSHAHEEALREGGRAARGRLRVGCGRRRRFNHRSSA